MIRRVAIQGYKSIRSTTVELSPLTVVFGPNAAGKSNLLDALGLTARMVTHDTLDAAFVAHRGTPLEAFSLPEGGVEELQQRSDARFTITVDVELSKAVMRRVELMIRRAREGLADTGRQRPRMVVEERLRYTLTVEILTASGHLRVRDERLEALGRDGNPTRRRRPFLGRDEHGDRLVLRMEKQGHPTYEEIGQDRTIVSKPLYPPHYPHIVAFREELAGWRFYFLDPVAMREDVALKEVDALAANGSDVAAFYNTVQATNELQFRALAKTLSQVIPSITGLRVERTAQGFLRLLVEEQGMPLSSRLVSEGTLRVLGLLAITNPLRPLTFVGFEEPENGVHPRRLAIVAQLLIDAAERGDTQFLINTHSPVLPEHFITPNTPGMGIIQCTKQGRETVFEPFQAYGGLLAGQDRETIEAALDDTPAPSSFADRLVRGDWGG